MATLTEASLKAALASGEIDGRSWHPSQQIQTMNSILGLIQLGPIDAVAIAESLRLNQHTVLQYCSWLERNGLISINHKGRGGRSIYQCR